jgi:hypothetical protein
VKERSSLEEILSREALTRIGAWLQARGEGSPSPPRFAIKFCGGCNPVIERGDVAEQIRQGLVDKVRWVAEEEEKDFILIINGCPTACADIIEVREKGPAIVISGP